MINEQKLRGLIAEKGYNITTFSRKIGMTVLTFRNKLTGKSEFSIEESLRIKHALDTDDKTYIEVFYKPNNEFNADSDFKHAE